MNDTVPSNLTGRVVPIVSGSGESYNYTCRGWDETEMLVNYAFNSLTQDIPCLQAKLPKDCDESLFQSDITIDIAGQYSGEYAVGTHNISFTLNLEWAVAPNYHAKD